MSWETKHLTPYATLTNFCLYTQNSSVYQIDHPLVILFTYFTVWTMAVSVCLTCILSIKKVIKDRLKKMCGHVWTSSVNQRSDVCLLHIFATFCSMGTLVRRIKTWRYSARKVMEFGFLMTDILVYVS